MRQNAFNAIGCGPVGQPGRGLADVLQLAVVTSQTADGADSVVVLLRR